MRDLIKYAVSVSKHSLICLVFVLSGAVVIGGIFSVMLLGTMLAIAYQSA